MLEYVSEITSNSQPYFISKEVKHQETYSKFSTTYFAGLLN
jgi:hypothetical protein